MLCLKFKKLRNSVSLVYEVPRPHPSPWDHALHKPFLLPRTPLAGLSPTTLLHAPPCSKIKFSHALCPTSILNAFILLYHVLYYTVTFPIKDFKRNLKKNTHPHKLKINVWHNKYKFQLCQSSSPHIIISLP